VAAGTFIDDGKRWRSSWRNEDQAVHLAMVVAPRSCLRLEEDDERTGMQAGCRWAGVLGRLDGLRPGKSFLLFFFCSVSFLFCFIFCFQISNLVLLNYFAGFELMSSYKLNLGYALTQHLVSGFN
jgi:hypothetical protein